MKMPWWVRFGWTGEYHSSRGLKVAKGVREYKVMAETEQEARKEAEKKIGKKFGAEADKWKFLAAFEARQEVH